MTRLSRPENEAMFVILLVFHFFYMSEPLKNAVSNNFGVQSKSDNVATVGSGSRGKGPWSCVHKTLPER